MAATMKRSRGLTPDQQLAYHSLRALAEDTLKRYPQFKQRILADLVGVHQSFVSNVVHGRSISFTTLERIVRHLMVTTRVDDRKVLREELERALRVLGNHRRR